MKDDRKMLIVCLYVDDLVDTRNDEAMFDEFKKLIMVEFDISNFGMIHSLLSIKVTQSMTNIFIS